ncbi:MAG: hypothetical protein R3263_12925 [Myxococcota bacterium]|nr:hypothetical protein [Myxococcota bacterium]
MAAILDERHSGGRTLRICANAACQWLAIGEQDQGAAYFQPSARDVVPGLAHGPGPVPEGTYLVAWLLAAAHHPTAHIGMLGLGSGIGAVAMAHEFPDLQLTVVERDPVVRELALAHFPLLKHFVATGRIAIVEADGVAWLQQGHADVLLLDMYPLDTALLAALTAPPVARALRRHEGAVWLNLALDAGDPAMPALLALLEQAGHTPVHALSTVHAPAAAPVPRNWVVTDQPWDAEAIAAYRPFDRLEGDFVDVARRAVRFVADSLRPAAELRDATR